MSSATAVLDEPALDEPGDGDADAPDAQDPAALLAPEAAPATRPLTARLAGLLRPLRDTGPYVGYVGCFVGAGLTGVGMVRYPLEPARYATIAAAGVVVFLLVTVVNEVVLAEERLPRARLLRTVAGSLLLSLGLGMLSGGIQHFQDLPARAADLIPAGLVLSFAAFQVRSAERVRTALLRPATLLVLLLAVALVPALRMLVPDGPVAAHGHGPGAATDAHGAADARGASDAHGAAAPAPATGHAPGPAPAPEADLDKALADLQARLAGVQSRVGSSG